MRRILAAVAVVASIATARADDPPADIVSQPLSPQESLKTIVVPKGFTVELIAAEPLVVDPVAFAWGPDGKFWVVEMNDYPLGLDGRGKPGGRVKFLTDDDGDGRYDRATVFLEGLQYPTSVLPWRGGVLVCAVPEIFYAADVDGDGRAERRETLYTGLHVGNPQHLANGLRYGLDHWIHCANGATKTAVRSAKTGKEVDVGTRDFRIRPDTGDIEPLAGRSQYLRECDDWGNWFGNSNSNPLFHFVLEEQYLRRNPHAIYPPVQRDVSDTPGAAQVFPISRTVTRFNDLSRANRFTSACSATIYRDEFLGREFYGNSFVCEPVHNLVHREVLEPDGVSFRSHRAPGEERSEFLASSDNWFRPAMVRTGPDGALYVADMYRLVIEHPEWIPKEWQAKLDLRAGSDKGRIYRVRPTDAVLWPIPRLDKPEPAELVKKLESLNGTLRDMTMQYVVERFTGREQRTFDTARVVDELIRLVNESPRPTTKVHALCTLAALDDELDSLVLRRAMRDEHPQVRQWAVRLVRPEQVQLDKHLVPEILKLVDDPDPTVRMQVAATLGDVAEAAAYKALARLLVAAADDPRQMAAAVSSLNADNVGPVTSAAVNIVVAQRRLLLPILGAAVDTAAATKNDEAIDALIRAAAGGYADAGRPLDERLAPVAKLLERLPAALRNDPELLRVVDHGLSVVADERAPAAEREQFLSLLGRLPDRKSQELAVVENLLSPRTPDALQAAAVAAMARVGDLAAADVLLTRWKGFGPARKAQVLDVCLARPAWAEKLVEAVAAKRVPPAEIDVTRAQQLLNHPNRALRDKAAAALVASIATDRKQVVEKFQSVVALAGDAARGSEVFKKSCGNCHKLGDAGQAVGPDLAALSDKSANSLLVSILDPNRAVESKYVGYVAETSAGLSYNGLLLAETSGSITLALADGKRQDILRNELESLASTGKSFMPEGLEKDLSAEKLADVIAFVAANKPPRKTFPGNEPRLVMPEALRGEFYLLAQDAAIYGDTLVFEPKFANLGYWQSANDRAEWEIEVAQAGDYDVWLEYACPDDAGGTYVVETGGRRLSGPVVPTGSWERFSSPPAGVLHLEPGKHTVVVRTDAKPRGALFDLKSVRIKPR